MLSKKIAQKRSELYKQIRVFFDEQKFTEVETPIMVEYPGMEPHLTPFETTLKIQNQPPKTLFLNTSPELQMKKLLASDFGNIYTMTKVFRNGETGGPMHNPEFTMLEWYRTKADYFDIMEDCENLITHLAKIFSKTSKTSEKILKLQKPWPRISTNDLFIKHCGIDLTKYPDKNSFKKIADKKGLDTKACEDWDDIFFKIFLNNIEPKLPKTPIFIYDYPSTQAALARKSEKNPFFAERFELYINAIELANAFSELIDADEQKQRLQEERELRGRLGKTVFDIDEEFIAALESISHPCAGIALGVDRLLMVLAELNSVEETLLFPIRYK